MVIPMLKIRRPTDRLIFIMGIPIPGKTVFYIETGPCFLGYSRYGYVSMGMIVPIDKKQKRNTSNECWHIYLWDLDLSPHPWPSSCIFKVRFWHSRISGIERAIRRKRCESIESWTHYMYVTVRISKVKFRKRRMLLDPLWPWPLTAHDLELGLSRSNFQKAISQ